MSSLPHLVDWTKPIEAVRKSDGKVVPVTLKERSHIYNAIITNEAPDLNETNEFWNEDGSDRCTEDKWFIRNRAEEVSNAEEVAPAKNLRDEFAMAALAASWDACDKGYFDGAAPDIAACAYQLADAMMAERAKGGEA